MKIKAKHVHITLPANAPQVIELDNPKPHPVLYTTSEGGDWELWAIRNHSVAHAIKFSDGSIFDMVNGWRK